MVAFEKYIPWVVYAEGRDIREFYFAIPSDPRRLKEILEVFAKHHVNIIYIGAYSPPGVDRLPVFLYADFTDLDVDVEHIKKELERVAGNKVYIRSPSIKGFIMNELAFPLYAFQDARLVVLLERDFQEMVRGIYEKSKGFAAVFLYHMAYAGGKFLANYLLERLSLKGKEPIEEILKVYQISGWGRVELVECDPQAMNIVLRLYDSVECKIFKGSKEPASQLIRGHLSGLLSGLLKADVRVMETKCIAKGDPYCEFHVERV